MASRRRFYTYVFRHRAVPVYVGAGQGERVELKSHLRPSDLSEKREYLRRWRHEITSEIALADATREEARLREAELIAEYGLLCDGGTLLNRTYGGWPTEKRAPRRPLRFPLWIVSRQEAAGALGADLTTVQRLIDCGELEELGRERVTAFSVLRVADHGFDRRWLIPRSALEAE